MTYRITATKDDHQVEQIASSDRLMKKWLGAFRRNGWKVGNVTEVKEGSV